MVMIKKTSYTYYIVIFKNFIAIKKKEDKDVTDKR